MNEIRLSKDTVLRLAPGVALTEASPGIVTLWRGPGRVAGALASAGRRVALCLGGLVCVGAFGAASFTLGAGFGSGLVGPVLADAASVVPAPPPVGTAALLQEMGAPPPPPVPRRAPAPDLGAAPAPRPPATVVRPENRPAARPDADPFGLAR